MAEDFVSVDTFIARSFITTSKRGLLRSNRFVIEFHTPKAFSPSGIKVGELMYNALAVACPNISVETGGMEINSWMQWYYKTRNDTDLSVTFLESADLKVRKFFESWINYGYDNRARKRRYIDEIVAPYFKVWPLDANGQRSTCDVFTEVFPYEVNGLEYNVSDENNILKTEVKLKFKLHYIE